jgi:hypothetical protein
VGKFQKTVERIRARFPENLPRNSATMDKFADAVLSIYDLPNTPDYKRAVIKAVHGLSQSTHRAPKYIFYTHMARFEVMRAAVTKVTEIEKLEKQAATPKPEALPDKTPQGTP